MVSSLSVALQGVPGEVYIGSPGIASKYLGDEVKTAQRFLPNPFNGQVRACLGEVPAHYSDRVYRTGDQGMLRPDGQLVLLGRIDSTVKIRAFKVSLLMVEQFVAEVEGVGAHAVQPIKDPLTNQPESLAAYVCGDGSTLPQKELLLAVYKHCKSKLPDYACPRYALNGVCCCREVDRAAP